MVVKELLKKWRRNKKFIYNSYFDKPEIVMKNTKFSVEDAFGDVLWKKGISTEEITKPNTFSAGNM